MALGVNTNSFGGIISMIEHTTFTFSTAQDGIFPVKSRNLPLRKDGIRENKLNRSIVPPCVAKQSLHLFWKDTVQSAQLECGFGNMTHLYTSIHLGHGKSALEKCIGISHQIWEW